MRPFDVSLDMSVIFGAGRVAEVGEIVRRCGVERAFVVTDPGVSEAGITSTVVDALGGIENTVFTGISPNPSTDDVEAGGAAFREFGLQNSAVVAVGGGSAMDAAKAISIHAANPYSARELTALPTDAPLNPGRPLIAVPTTAGTAAETNGFGVITDAETHRKAYIGDESVKPRFSVLDPELTLGLPPSLTAATGIDALSHALESLMSRNGNPYSEALALRAIRTISRWLPTAVKNGRKIEARSHMLLASNLAGQAFATGTGLGLCHAIAHPLGARLGMPHGVAIARLLPAVMEFNRSYVSEKLAEAAIALDPSTGVRPEEGRSLAAIRAVSELVRETLSPEVLSASEVTDEMLPLVVRDALEDPVILNTPVMPDDGDIERILADSGLRIASVESAGR